MLKKIQKFFSYKQEIKENETKIKILEEEVAYLNTVIVCRDRATARLNKLASEQFKLIKNLCFGNNYSKSEFNRLNQIEKIAEENIKGISYYENIKNESRNID